MNQEHGERPILVIGSAGVDIIGKAHERIRSGTSNPSSMRTSYGGVARNVAENLVRLGMEVELLTAVGDDDPGRRLLAHARELGIGVDHACLVKNKPTGTYLAVLDEKGNLQIALDDMRTMEALTPAYLHQKRHLFTDAQAVFIDANLRQKPLATAIGLARRARIPIAADPTSVKLAPRLYPHLKDFWLITPNESEADALCPHPVPHADPGRAIEAARHLVSEGVEIAIITMAEFGLGYATPSSSGHVPALKTDIKDPTGAGDALNAAVIFALLNDIPLDEAVLLGLAAASLTLKTEGTVVPDLSLERLYDQLG
jgi:pseudouridine kinase